MNIRAVIASFCLALLATMPRAVAEAFPPAHASAWATSEHTAVRLIAGTDAVGSGDHVVLGLEFRMDRGWHIYWRSPGDAGYPPRMDWTGSDNLASAGLAWPAPTRFTVLDLETVGYEGAVILPVDVRLRTPAEPLAARARVDYLTCADICVPVTAELTLVVPAGSAHPSSFAPAITAAQAAVPRTGATANIRVDEAILVQGPEATELRLALSAETPIGTPDAFVEAEPPLAFGAPTATFSGDRTRALLRLPVFNLGELPHPVDDLPATLTIVDGTRSAETTLTVRRAASPGDESPEPAPTRARATILAFAVLGGLILNLMPCVLPVLSIKLLAAVGHAGGERRAVRTGFIASALGIVFSFLLLATGLLLLRESGAAIGWGVQFQQPWFLTAMILVVTLFACNLWGLFEIPLPRLAAFAGERAGDVRGLAGHFLSGALATLLATPCSAPFLGTAVGFALSRGPADIFAVFTAIALGLAAPYLAVAAFPEAATRLPKPGRWMFVLRRGLACSLAVTAVWLVWVLSGSLGSVGASVVAASAVTLAILLAIRPRLPARLRAMAAMSIVVLSGTAFVVGPGLGSAPQAGGGADKGWTVFDPKAIPQMVARGETVFVNVTADWCVTCKVNERLVLEQPPVSERLGEDGVVAMRADWTTPDDRITRWLGEFGRHAIPFDAVFGPAAPRGVVLPELLTTGVVMDALDRAEGKLRSDVER